MNDEKPGDGQAEDWSGFDVHTFRRQVIAEFRAPAVLTALNATAPAPRYR